MKFELICCELPPSYMTETTSRNIHDHGFKHLLSNERILKQFLKRFTNIAALQNIDRLELTSENTQFIKRNFSTSIADLVYRVRDVARKFDFFVILELQSKPDQMIAVSQFGYLMEKWRLESERFKNESERLNQQQLPIRIPNIIL